MLTLTSIRINIISIDKNNITKMGGSNMRLISILSFHWARAIADKFYDDNKRRKLYYYWIRLLFGTFVKMAIVLGIAKLLDVFMPTLICALTYGAFKFVTGGMHHRYLGRSVLLSVMLFITMGVVADTFYYIYKPFNDVLTNGPTIYMRVMFEFSFWTAVLFVPIRARHRLKLWKVRSFLHKVVTIILIRMLMEYTQGILEVETLSLVMALWTATAFSLASSIPVINFGMFKLNQILNYK